VRTEGELVNLGRKEV